MLVLVRSVDELRTTLQMWRSHGLRIGFVPTMGYLHEGHLSLLSMARNHADRVVVSIYVNPTQFGPGEDLDRYPRDLEGDRQKIEQAGADLLFVPTTQEMYPAGAQTYIQVRELSLLLCGVDRPTHFQGVATVVAKLFHLVQPDVAVFGEKDYQQLQIIRQMVRDLMFPVKIVGGEIVREPDGLAMSSRNAYLTPAQRQTASCLSAALRLVRWAFASGETNAETLLRLATHRIGQEPDAQIQYIELCEPDTLLAVQGAAKPEDRMFLAVKVGSTRLIDNAPLMGNSTLDG